MKFLSLTIIIGCLFHACTFQSRPQSESPPVQTLTGPPCASGSVVAKEHLDAPVRLTIADARCDGSHWTARVILRNASDKVITAYDIADIETYEHKKDVASSQGRTGIALSPGASLDIKSGGGFRDGLSYGKPTGAFVRTVFRVTRIEFADGSVWQESSNSS